MSTAVPNPAEVKQAFHEELHPGQQNALISWVAFTGTFATLRAITYSIKEGRGPLHDVSVGGIHVHHYMWGILGVSLVGGVALRGDDPRHRHPTLAVAYGSCLALIVDEFALLLDLRDVYWAREGRSSVDLAIGLIAGTGSVMAALPVLRRLRRNRN